MQKTCPGPRTRAPADAAERARLRLASLLQRSAGGDQTAFAGLYAATVRKLRWNVTAVLGAGADVDDVLQEAYLRIWNSGHQFDPRRSSPMTWMLVIARNVAVDRIRSNRRHVHFPINDEAMSVAEPPADPFEHRDRAVEVQVALAVITRIAPERAELLSRAYLEERRRETLARDYGAPPSTIKTWIRRSLAEVRKQLESEPDGHPSGSLAELAGATA